MNTDTTSTRRSFLKGGALLAAPLAAAVPAAIMADDELKARLARLEDEAAIRELHQTWLRRINTGAGDATASLYVNPEAAALDQAVRGIAADHAGEPDAIEVAADRKRAAGRFHVRRGNRNPDRGGLHAGADGARARQRLRPPHGAPRGESRIREGIWRVGDREGRVRRRSRSVVSLAAVSEPRTSGHPIDMSDLATLSCPKQ